MTRPNDPRDGTGGRRSGVGEGELRPRPLDQGLGDEQSQPQTRAAILLVGLRALRGTPGGHVGLSDPEEDIGRISRPVIPDLLPDMLLC